MRVLFFDLEFAHSKNGGKICEFGYVVTNEKLEILRKENMIINPNIERKKWDWYAVKNILTRSVEDYEKEKTFDKYYPRIKTLIESADYIFGHSLYNDVKVLNAELKNFHYSPITFNFYDVKDCFKEYLNINKDISLTNICEKLKICTEGKKHNALDDAINAMLILKEIIQSENLTIKEIIELCPTMKYETSNYIFKQVHANHSQKIVNEKGLKYFIKYTQKNCDGNDLLKNKKIYICYNFTKKLKTQTKNLIQLVVNEGGEVVGKTEDADIFIQLNESIVVDNEIIEPMTNKYYEEAIGKGKIIEKVYLNEFLNNLNINIDDLSNEICYYNTSKNNKITEKNNCLTISIAEIFN